MRQVECDAAFDVVPKVEVPQRCQGDVEDDDHKHPDVQNHGEKFWKTASNTQNKEGTSKTKYVAQRDTCKHDPRRVQLKSTLRTKCPQCSDEVTSDNNGGRFLRLNRPNSLF